MNRRIAARSSLNIARPNAFASAPLLFRIIFVAIAVFWAAVLVTIILTFTGVIHPFSGISYHYEESYGTNGYSHSYDYGYDR